MATPATILDGKILLVDNQPANIRRLATMLQQAGYLNVGTTADPTGVCDLHRTHLYDLILLALPMPVMDGFAVMEALKPVEPAHDLIVVAVTNEPAARLRALKAGARNFIGTPFDDAEVLPRLHTLLEIRLLHEEARNQNSRLENTVRERTAELRGSEEMFRQLAANIPEALWIRDTDDKTIQYVNPAWEKLCGFSAAPGDAVDKVYRAIHPDDLQWVTHERRKAPGTHVSSEYRLVRPDDSVRWVNARTFPIANPSGKAPWVVEIIEDVTQRKEAQRQLVHLARHDALTGLPNRALLHDALKEALTRADAAHQTVSVLLLDIDYFKLVNDTLGHPVGDALLCRFAERLAECIRPGDIVGRLGGDEFAVIMQAAADENGAAIVAERIQNALRQPFLLDGQTVSVGTSIGIASHPTDTSDLEELLRYADAAMYDAKASGRGVSRRYTKEMNARAAEKSDMEGALRLAQERDEFVLHYQPKMQIDGGKWTGAEALIRWNRPGQGLVAPFLFIPALEEMGLIVPVGAWVIDTACRQIREWQLLGLGSIRIAVNISSRQVREERFVSQVAEALKKHAIDPALLELEITEGTLMAHGEATDGVMRRLKALGVCLSIDDFGTGYSNLAYLKRFRVDVLKIDIAFIRDVTTDNDAAIIVVAIINMAHSLRLKVIAEGVETQEQLEFLRRHGCDEVQGYLISKPLPAEQITVKFQHSAVHEKVAAELPSLPSTATMSAAPA